MDHFYQNIDGWFNCEDLYREMVRRAPDGARFVEVGAWKGKSTVFMAVEIINSGKSIDFIVVDSFEGSKEHQNDASILDGTLEDEYERNTMPVQHVLSTIVQRSTAAARMFRDNSLDFVYIDASHEYEDVLADIAAWLPKVKPGGVLAGDDYTSHEGVRRAVDELLPKADKDGLVWSWTV